MSNEYQQLKVVRIVEETTQVNSYYLEPVVGGSLESYLPGQHLLFRLPVYGTETDRRLLRFYTLSDCSNQKHYRLSIKRELAPPRAPEAPAGVGSEYFHDKVKVGDVLEAKGPMGDFYLEPNETTPVVLVGGGIGLTPILSMLNAIVDCGVKREVYLFLGMRNQSEHPFKASVEKIAAEQTHIHLNVCYDEATDADRLGIDYQYADRVSVSLFKQVLPTLDLPYYICGPGPMMDALTADLAAEGVSAEKIHTESFGPASPAGLTPKQSEAPDAEAADVFEVLFAQSEKSFAWEPEYTSLLEFAEAKGVGISAGCLYGDCGTCLTRIESGEVEYNHPTAIDPGEGHCLPCSCRPKGKLVLSV